MTGLICKFCGGPFVAGPRNKRKFCSSTCSTNWHNQNKFPRLSSVKVDSCTTGAIAELKVSVDLMSKGYEVFRALSPSSSCDLIALRNGKSSSIEVRTAYRQTSGRIFAHRLQSDTAQHYAFCMAGEIVYDPPLQTEVGEGDGDCAPVLQASADVVTGALEGK